MLAVFYPDFMFEVSQYVFKPGSMVKIGDIITSEPTAKIPNPAVSLVVEIYGEFSGDIAADSLREGCFKQKNLFIVKDIVLCKSTNYTIEVEQSSYLKKFVYGSDDRIGIFGPFSKHTEWKIYTKI